MKKTRLLTLLLAAVMVMLCACGAASETAAYDAAANGMVTMEEAAEAPMAQEAGLYSISGSTADTAQTTAEDQKFIVQVNISAETEDLDALLQTLDGKIAELGGYVEYQDIYNGSTRNSYRYRSASLTIRIPAQQLDGFVEQVKGQSNVVSMNRSRENVTLTYVATESRMKALETEQERLLELMEQAETMADLLEVEARLTEVRSELESVTSQLRVLSNQVDYATVYLNIDQVTTYTEVEEQSVWQRIGSGFRKNLANIGEGLQDFFVWLVTYSPQLLVFAAAVIAVVMLIRRSSRKRREKKNKMPPFEVPPQEQEKKE